MSNACRVVGALRLRDGIGQEQARAALGQFISHHGIDFEHEAREGNIEIEGGMLALSLDVRGMGGYKNDSVESLASELASVAEGGQWIEFQDFETSNLDCASTPYFVGDAAEQALGRLRYGVRQMEEWVRPIVGDEAFDKLSSDILALGAASPRRGLQR